MNFFGKHGWICAGIHDVLAVLAAYLPCIDALSLFALPVIY
jgi:hypothetical protein